MTRELVTSALNQELATLLGAQLGEASEEQLLSQVINSMGFLQLLLAMERRLGVTIDDEALYDAAPVTVGDLISFLSSLVETRHAST